MIRKTLVKQQKNNRTGFALFECVIVIALLSLCFFALQPLYRLYSSLMVHAAADNIAAVYTYLSHCAAARHTTVSLWIGDERVYVVNDGVEVKKYYLPVGVAWGAPAGVMGPPSRPTMPVTMPVVGGEKVDGGTLLTWHPSGASTPSTCYLCHAHHCCAVSVSRAGVGMVTSWTLTDGGWRKNKY